jgi:selenocysteine lyase/cysteine desulfurase
VAGVAAIEDHEDRLCRRIEAGLGVIDGFVFHGHGALRTPTLLFSVTGTSPKTTAAHLADRGGKRPRRHSRRPRGRPASTTRSRGSLPVPETPNSLTCPTTAR